jgi:hypothetical protein
MKEIIMKGRNIRKGIKMNLEIKEIQDGMNILVYCGLVNHGGIYNL